jgi:hypothetical protein
VVDRLTSSLNGVYIMKIWEAVVLKKEGNITKFKTPVAKSINEVADQAMKLQFKGYTVFQKPRPIGKAA